jgi:hypothetical protein
MLNDKVSRDFIMGRDATDVEAYIDSVAPESFESFVSGLIVSIHKVIREIESNANDYYHFSEDSLSGLIASIIEGHGYKAKNETKERGRVDITIEKDGFVWLIEAKKGYNNQKVFEGLLQLTSRYLTRQQSAGLFIYYQKPQPSKEFKSWGEFIKDKKWVDYAANNSILDECNEMFGELVLSDDKLCVNDTLKKTCLTSAGSQCDIYSFGINCHFKPVDISGRGNKSLKKNQALIYIEHAYHDYLAGESFDIEKLMSSIDEHFSYSKELN